MMSEEEGTGNSMVGPNLVENITVECAITTFTLFMPECNLIQIVTTQV